MIFHSILFEKVQVSQIQQPPAAPGFFGDLNLDQVIDAITASKTEYNLKPFFYTLVHDVDTIRYRYEVMQELENKAVFEYIQSFAQQMHSMREQLAQAAKLYYQYQKASWFLAAVGTYCEAVCCLAQQLAATALRARGLLAFRTYIAEYSQSVEFTALRAETNQLKTDLAAVQYCLLINGNHVEVCRYKAEADYSAEIEKAFAKFKQADGQSYLVGFYNYPDMNHVEAKILDFVANLYPITFAHLDNYCTKYVDYLDETLAIFDREIQFYIAYLEYLVKFKQTGLDFCYAQISATNKEVCVYDGFDLVLANKLVTQKAPIIRNDFYLAGPERIMVVSGPNQGGKTTFARLFGQLHYLAGIGCPVPGREAKLFLVDNIFTHFEKEEDIKNLRGKLADDLVRIYDNLTQATPNSIVIMNEIFTSTTLRDALFLSAKIMKKIIELDLLCVWVTFIAELAVSSNKTVSMVSMVLPDNPAQRTYKIKRQPAGRRLYALTIAEKYGLTYDCLKERIK